MSDENLRALAEAVGLSPQWTDYRGVERSVGADVLRAALNAMKFAADTDDDVEASLQLHRDQQRVRIPSLLVARCDQYLRLPPALNVRAHEQTQLQLQREDGEWRSVELARDEYGTLLAPIPWPGYHALVIGDLAVPIAVAPQRAYTPADASSRSRLWGLSTQLYGLRSNAIGDCGCGDFNMLAELARAAAQQGADVLAMSPVHALYTADSNHFSPYSPSSRLFLNALHIDVGSIVAEASLRDMIAALDLGSELARLQALEQVDWPAAAHVKFALLRKLWSQLGARWMQSDNTLALSFQVFRQRGGQTLENHARFEALHAREYARDGALWNWRNWSPPLRDPDSTAVTAFADSHVDEIGFHIFLQWLASRGLHAAQRAARDEGMAIGLIADLAVGTDNGGSHVWSRQDDFLVGLQVGAPPDAINTHGQDWGLTTFSPTALQHHAFTPFLDVLRANLQHAGGLRIDHILGMRRLWVLPSGAKATEGVYLQYPQDDLLNLIALESQRHRAVIVGEDLGTVPPGFSEQLAERGILGMQVLWFQRDYGFFIEPSRWSPNVLATTSTHDLPTVAGWWQGRDIEWMERAEMLPEHLSAEQLQGERGSDREALWAAFTHADVAADGETPAPAATAAVVDGAIDFVARTPAALAIIPMEDLLGLDEQPNLPGTIDQHPNWRRRLSKPVAELLSDTDISARLRALNRERG